MNNNLHNKSQAQPNKPPQSHTGALVESGQQISIALGSISVVIALAYLLSLAGNSSSLEIHMPFSDAGTTLPLFGLCVAFIFVLQWLAFIPAYLTHSEKFYDIMGSLTFISIAGIALAVSSEQDLRSVLLILFVATWAARLGSFLFLRIHGAKSDKRFDKIKRQFFTFLMTWTLQGMWVLFCISPALMVWSHPQNYPIDTIAVIGIALWLVGFTIEVVADRQKSKFRAQPENAGQFITQGLWARSQHPNYFGEILLWIGICVLALPALEGWRYVVLLSPLFVWLQLTKISGVRMLDNLANKRWGSDPEYQQYVKNTPVLIPRLF